MVVFKIFGVVNDVDYYYCESIAKKIAASIPDSRVEASVGFEVDYWIKIDEFKVKLDHKLQHYMATHLVIVDDQVIGNNADFAAFVTATFEFVVDVEASNTVLFNRSVREGFYDMMKNNPNPIVHIQFGQQDLKRPKDFEVIGSIYVELFANLCPKAVENFLNFCDNAKAGKSRHKYSGTNVHRLVKNGWIQTGDVVDGSGKNSVASLSDGYVPDESFSIDFGAARGGIVGYANEGAHSSKSQFFVTLASSPWMNNKFVGFGRVLQGYAVLKQLNNLPTSNQVPVRPIQILECGNPPEFNV